MSKHKSYLVCNCMGSMLTFNEIVEDRSAWVRLDDGTTVAYRNEKYSKQIRHFGVVNYERLSGKYDIEMYIRKNYETYKLWECVQYRDVDDCVCKILKSLGLESE